MKTTIKKHLCRVCSIYAKDNPKVPAELFSFKNEKADLKGFEFISPVKKSDYTIALKAGKVLWLGSDKGLVRVDPEPADYFDKVLYFSADRDLKDNNVLAIMGDEINVWVLTETGVSEIHLISLTGEEKADLLLKETQMYVDRHGMITQKALAVPGDVTSAVEWGHSDNDGCFTANFAVGEIYKYATLCRELGEDHEKTKEALNTSVRAIEAILLLMHVCKRG
ncbi:MAG: hypothetical protein K6B52_08640, partial [Clostridiales bacterium]|nr:hypothetical protein [Clostridiales bacterium]